MDTALQCLVLVARQHGVDLTVDRLKREHAISEPEVSEEVLVTLATEAGLEVKSTKLSWAQLAGAGQAFPIIARLTNGFSVVLVGMRKDDEGTEKVMVLDPLSADIELIAVDKERFESRWSGRVLLVRASKSAEDQSREEFGFGWFIDQVMALKPLFGQVAIIALVLHVLTFVPAVFTMIVLDKVVTFRSEDTLHVLFAGVMFAMIFQSVLGYVRSVLLLYATSKIDIRAAGFSYQRLMALPLSFFQSSPAGILVKHMQQTSQIREFFTGSLLLTLIELTSLIILIPVLAFFSIELLGIVLIFAALIAVNSVVGIRPYKTRLSKLYEVEGDKQAILIETIGGMETVKTLALEPFQARRWLDRSAQAVRMQFEVGKLSTLTSEVSGFLMRSMSVVVIWSGTLLFFNNKMTIGALIAFNMLAQRVTGPLVQMVGLINKYQQAALSVRMLAGLLNRRTERSRRGGITTDIEGHVTFDRVMFRYAPEGAPTLDNISLDIEHGQRIGVVGRSGSGKSTLVRLIQGLHYPSGGVLRVDGRDIREYDLMHLRMNVGVVLQRSFLFKGTVKENIARARPEAGLEEVIQAAQLAGADQFIEHLPQSYDTMIEEDGSNLSGGQKQRIALARALVMRPRILILDEATSALDPESEAVIRDNFDKIAAGRTVFNVSHRLTNLTGMDAILVLDAGQVVDYAPHHILVERCEVYQTLWYTQNPHLRT